MSGYLATRHSTPLNTSSSACLASWFHSLRWLIAPSSLHSRLAGSPFFFLPRMAL